LDARSRPIPTMRTVYGPMDESGYEEHAGEPLNLGPVLNQHLHLYSYRSLSHTSELFSPPSLYVPFVFLCLTGLSFDSFVQVMTRTELLKFPLGDVPTSVAPSSMGLGEMMLTAPATTQRVRRFRLRPSRCSRICQNGRGFRPQSIAHNLGVPHVMLQRLPDCLVSGLLTRQPQVQGWLGFRRTSNHDIVTFMCHV
jgi:hypothetical protein